MDKNGLEFGYISTGSLLILVGIALFIAYLTWIKLSVPEAQQISNVLGHDLHTLAKEAKNLCIEKTQKGGVTTCLFFDGSEIIHTEEDYKVLNHNRERALRNFSGTVLATVIFLVIYFVVYEITKPILSWFL